jgi:hypothetical protein
MIKFEMEYADAATIEFALHEFILSEKREIHRLQRLPERSPAEKAQIKECENRIRNTGRTLRIVFNALNDSLCEEVWYE